MTSERVTTYTGQVTSTSTEEGERYIHAWLTKRRRTTYIIYMYALLYGSEYSAIVVTLYFYLEETLKVAHISLYYSVSMTAMSIMASVAGLICGRYIDRTRSIRKFVLTCVLITMLGNFLYCVHFSVWFIIFGRLLCGLGEAINSALSGELARVYSSEDLHEVIYKFQVIYTIGFVMGPALNVVFLKVDISIGQLHINKYNCIGLFLGMVLAIYNIFAYFCLSDLSHRKEDMCNGDALVSKRPEEISEVSRMKVIFTSFSIMMIILSASVINYIAVITELILPIISNKEFHWNIERLSIVTTVCIAIFAVCMLLLGYYSVVSRDRMYLIYLGCLPPICVSLMLLALPGTIRMNTVITQTSLFVLITLINSFCGMMSVAIAKTMYLSLVPSESASFYEGVRYAVYRAFGMAAFFSASFVTPYLILLSPLLSLTLVVFFVIFCVHKRYFLDILLYEKVQGDDNTKY